MCSGGCRCRSRLRCGQAQIVVGEYGEVKELTVLFVEAAEGLGDAEGLTFLSFCTFEFFTNLNRIAGRTCAAFNTVEHDFGKSCLEAVVENPEVVGDIKIDVAEDVATTGGTVGAVELLGNHFVGLAVDYIESGSVCSTCTRIACCSGHAALSARVMMWPALSALFDTQMKSATLMSFTKPSSSYTLTVPLA